MGGVSSKHGNAPQGINFAALPADQVPYTGPLQQYSFMNLSVQMKANFTFGFAPGENVVSSNVDEYYPFLAQNYNEGFKIVQFLKIPLSQQTGMFSTASTVPYQAVYCRKAADSPPANSWQLKIEKSIIHMQRLGGGMLFSFRQNVAPAAPDIANIYEIVQNNAAKGGRFVCMEQTGMAQSQGFGMAMSGVGPGMGTDLFFNMPLHPNPVMYTYMAISVPIPLSYSYGFSGSIDMVCDWAGILAQHLNQGWRLADIYMDDMQQLSQQRNHRGTGLCSALNSIWFFEKEVSRMNDPTPLYQATYLEYNIKAKAGLGSIKSDFDITQLCQEMGNRGWKLTCVLQTPKMSRVGFTSVTNAVLLFFQRRLVGPLSPAAPMGAGMAMGAGMPTAPPPSYDDASKIN